jgi:hypothetical protein
MFRVPRKRNPAWTVRFLRQEVYHRTESYGKKMHWEVPEAVVCSKQPDCYEVGAFAISRNDATKPHVNTNRETATTDRDTNRTNLHKFPSPEEHRKQRQEN